LLNGHPNSFWILNDFVRPKAQDAPPVLLHQCGTTCIGLDSISVMLAIDLNDELPRYAGEISKVVADWMLAAKFDATHTNRQNS